MKEDAPVNAEDAPLVEDSTLQMDQATPTIITLAIVYWCAA